MKSPWGRKAAHLARAVGIAAHGLADPNRPILAQLVVMRRCNLACAYCNEYDKTSSPVPLKRLSERLLRLAELKTEIVTFTGGEPLLHPELDAVIRRARNLGLTTGMITNAYFLQPERIEALNEAGLQYLQISIDNVEPDDVSAKSLKLLDKKLRHLSKLARFFVNIQVVLGSGCERPEDARIIARRARELGFTTSVSLIHDESGALKPLGEREASVYDEVVRTGKGTYTRINGFQRNLVRGKPNQWSCRAGARFLYICEEGLVHYCSQQRGTPGIPLMDYGENDLQREFETPKPCAPYCTLSCVHRASWLDGWRAQGREVAPIESGDPEPV